MDDVAGRVANPRRDADATVVQPRCLPAAGKFTRLGRRERSVSSRMGSLYSPRLLMKMQERAAAVTLAMPHRDGFIPIPGRNSSIALRPRRGRMFDHVSK